MDADQGRDVFSQRRGVRSEMDTQLRMEGACGNNYGALGLGVRSRCAMRTSVRVDPDEMRGFLFKEREE